MAPVSEADDLIRRLKLEPHPEGGFYRRIWTHAELDADGRPLASAIHYLVRRDGADTIWHRVDADELWTFNAGAELEIEISDSPPGGDAETGEPGPDGRPTPSVERQVIGPATAEMSGSVLSSPSLSTVVAAHSWQRCRTLGEFTLVTCVVVPGFVWEGFDLLAES